MSETCLVFVHALDECSQDGEMPRTERCGGKTVRVAYTNTDQYGRILGIIYLGETDINLQMVKDGCAWHYKHFDKTPAYAEAERAARDAKRGLWASPDPVNPYQWRKAKR